MIDIDALEALAKAARDSIIRSHGWESTVEMGEHLGKDEAFMKAASPAAILALIAEVRRLRERREGHGTPVARMEYLHDELDKRFPDAVNPVLSDPPEPKYLAAIDALVADGERYRWLKSKREDFDTMGGASYHATKLWNALGRMPDWDAAIDAARGAK